MMRIGFSVLIVAVGFSSSLAGADWPTARGNAQRTGNVDGQPGPKAGKVLWAQESPTDQYISAVSPGDKVVFVPAMGTLNSGVISSLSSEAGAGAKRVVWSKSQPVLKLPTVCSPAVVGGRIIFGDGMHQNESPTLYCMDASTGNSIWQLPIPGALIHLEATPTVVDGKAYVGAGNGGVICVDLAKLTLDGKDVDAAAITAANAALWKEMQAKYEQDLKKDPDFAMKPDPSRLKIPAPKVLWQQGAGAKPWHVDCPVAVVGDNVLAGSAYLETEKSGDRAVFCLEAGTGKVKWRTPAEGAGALKHNPWGGPSAAGDIVIVACSSIRFDPKEIKGAQGEIVALNLADGSVKWRKDVAGGVVSAAAIAADTVIFTATDKQVYALDVKTGADKGKYKAGAPFFAGVAVAGDTVYAADLNGVVYALGLNGLAFKWKMDVGKEAKALGNIYGSPVIDGGRLYVGTCNLDVPNAKTVIVCVGEK